MGIFNKQDENLDSLYDAINKNGRINNLLYNDCYEYGKLTPKTGKTDTSEKLKELSKKNRKDLDDMINKRKK